MPPVANAENIFREPRIASKKTSPKKDTQTPAPVVPPKCHCKDIMLAVVAGRGDLSKGQHLTSDEGRTQIQIKQTPIMVGTVLI